jgi:transcriptional regulator with XRE-family HTH domain
MEREQKKIEGIVRHIRKARGISQMDLAERVGVSYQQIQKYEKGVDNLSIKRLGQIAQALNVPITVFFPPEKETACEPLAPYGKLTDEEQFLLHSFRSIKDRIVRKAVLDFLKNLSARKSAKSP